MLAALLLESDFPILLADTVQMSNLRAGSAIPMDLNFPYMRSLRSRRCKSGWSVMYALTVPLLLATTVLLQLASTTLISDLSVASLPGPKRFESRFYDFEYRPRDGNWAGYTINNLIRSTSVWVRSPYSFPAFAEYLEPVDVPETVDETGIVFRTLLPFRDPQSREKLDSYAGKAFVFDARVSCQRPTLTNVSLDDGYLSGSYMPTESVHRLRLPACEMPFVCTVHEYFLSFDGPSDELSICRRLNNSGSYNYRDGGLISEFHDLEGCSDPGKECFPLDDTYLVAEVRPRAAQDGGKSTDKLTTAHGAWTDLYGVTTSKKSSKGKVFDISVSLCYPAFWIARQDVEIHSLQSRTEPVPQMNGELYYTSPDIRPDGRSWPRSGEIASHHAARENAGG